MSAIPAFAAASPGSLLAPLAISRRAPGPHDVDIDILYCGVCHSDIHQARDEWGHGIFPMVPGHEIVGRVIAIGDAVSRHRIGDLVGVGCFVDSCRRCASCEEGEEQFCIEGMVATYNSKERTGAPTFGGYSTRIVVDENYVLKVPASLSPERAAPLLCAGVTTWSPLRRFGAGPGSEVAVVGLGGLGHMAVKLAVALGARVTVLSTSESKRADALALGAQDFAATGDKTTFKALAGRFDLILDSVSAPHDYNAYLGLLRRDGTMVLLGIPDQPTPLAAGVLIMQRRCLTGSLIGGIRETQEMLDFCGEHGITADTETIPMQDINSAYERMLRGDVRYRFVIDLASLKS